MDDSKDAKRLARLRNQRDAATCRYNDGVALAPMNNFQWIEVDFLLNQLDKRDAIIASLTQKRAELRKLHEVLALPAIPAGHDPDIGEPV